MWHDDLSILFLARKSGGKDPFVALRKKKKKKKKPKDFRGGAEGGRERVREREAGGREGGRGEGGGGGGVEGGRDEGWLELSVSSLSCLSSSILAMLTAVFQAEHRLPAR